MAELTTLPPAQKPPTYPVARVNTAFPAVAGSAGTPLLVAKLGHSYSICPLCHKAAAGTAIVVCLICLKGCGGMATIHSCHKPFVPTASNCLNCHI